MDIATALSIYTDKIIDGEYIDKETFAEKLSKEDFYDFLDEAKTIDLLFSYRRTENFDVMFKKIDKYKNTVCDMPMVANFRSDGISDEDKKEIEGIFDELFDE